MGSSHNTFDEPSCILSELLRRTLSLVEYYGHREADGDALLELKVALIRAIDRLEAGHSANADGTEPGLVTSLRKGPHAESIDPSQINKEQDAK
jgi:hypothetical protein